MNDPAELFQEFSALSDEEKIENFERSTIQLVLRQLGKSPKEVKELADSLGPSFDWDWFNSEIDLSVQVVSTRYFKFNMIEFFTRPTKHPVVADFYTRSAVDKPLCVVFKAHDYGRMIITNMKLPDYTHIHVVVGGKPCNIVQFNDFFSNHFKDPT